MYSSAPRKLAALLFTLITLVGLSSCSATKPAFIVITHVTVIDATGAPPQPDSTVAIVDSRISTIGSSASATIPPGARVIDGTGKFLIPGLADMHLHLTGAGEPEGSREFILPLLVANGVTTVRDMGGNADYLKQLRKEIDSGERLGPQIFFTGPYLDGDPPYFQPSLVVRNAGEAASGVQQIKSSGADFVKVQSRLQPEAYFAIAREASRQGMRFVGHVPDSISASAASDAGQASIEHLTGVMLACSTREEELRRRQLAPLPQHGSVQESLDRLRAWQRDLLASQSPEQEAKLFQKFVKNGTWQVPTFPLLIHLAFLTPETDLSNDPRLKFIPGNVRKNWEEGRRESLEHEAAPDFALRKQMSGRLLVLVGKMNAAGVGILAGTDTGAPNVFPGFSLHEDLFHFTEAGLRPLQALQAATAKPAEFLHRSETQGTIAVGQRADLVLLDANPLDDIRNTQKIRAVILQGKYLDRADLDAMLAKVERFAAAH